MKITFVLPVFNMSGGNRVVAIYCEGLRRLGHEVFAIGPPPRPLSWSHRTKWFLKGRGWQPQVHQGPSHFSERRLPHVILDRKRPVLAADLPDADVVVATWWETAEWVQALPASKGAKAYLVQHHEVFPYLPVHRVESTYRLSIPKIAIAQWLADLMINRYGNPSDRVYLVPNAVDHSQFHALARGKNDQTTVGLLYSTTHYKGTDIALRAFDLAAHRHSDLRLIAFGAKPISLQMPLPHTGVYHLLPPQDRLRELYASCDAWLFPSRTEGFGLPLLEAMACRTPVIGTPAGAAPELISQGGGILVRPEDPEDMARAIETIYHMTDEEWRQMSDLAYATAARYTWADTISRLEQVLIEIARGHGKLEVCRQAFD